MQISGRQIKGQGFSAKVGWATINLTNDSDCTPGFYRVHHEKHGEGYLFVFLNGMELHFVENVDENTYGKKFTLDITSDMLSQYSSPLFEILKLGFDSKYKSE